MDTLLQELTPNMFRLYKEIITALGSISTEQKFFLFGEGTLDDMELVLMRADYIALEFIKYSYDCESPEYPISHFYDITNDSERMKQSRIMKYIAKHKEREIKLRPLPSGHKFADLNLDSIKKRLNGHRLTEMNFFENQVIHDVELVKSIIERRIIDTKKVSNSRFENIFKQYDDLIESLKERSVRSDEDMVFASLAFFTFEWHYPIEFFYNLSCFMEEKGITEIDQDKLILLCGGVEIESRFGGSVSTDSRMVIERLILLDYIFSKETPEDRVESCLDMIKEFLVLVVQFKENTWIKDEGLFKEWFRKESKITDWASFLRYYDLFSIWQRKEWTRLRIRNMRYLFSISLVNKGKS